MPLDEGEAMAKKKKTVAAASTALLKKPKKPRAKAKQPKGLPVERLRIVAAKHRPPQSWFEENLDDI